MVKVILDFDGTLTDSWQEGGEEYQRLHAEEFSKRTRVPIERVNALNALNQAAIRINPEEGWLNNGKVVAPAGADPYVLTTAVYQKVIDVLRKENEGQYNLPENSQQTSELLGDLFNYCSKAVKDCFAPGAQHFLETLVNDGSVVIVTNSEPDKVLAKVSRLTGRIDIPVVGDAKKYIVTNDHPESVREILSIPGLERPVYLRRGHYFDTLKKLESQGFTPETTTVVGDMYELDHALPLEMGYSGILLDTPGTFHHEREYLSSHPRGFVAKNLDDVLNILHL